MLLSVLSAPFSGNSWRWFLYFGGSVISVVSADCSSTCSISDHVTINRVYRTFIHSDIERCVIECYNDANCSSYNYAYEPLQFLGHICQLSKCSSNKSLVAKRGFWFHQLKPSLNEELCNKPELFGLESSVILRSREDPNYFKVLLKYLGLDENRAWKRCFRSGKPGLNTTLFHRLCDSKGPTVTIVRVGKYVFGGYIDVSWESPKECHYSRSDHAFLFSLYNVDGFKPRKFPVKNPRYAALLCSMTGPIFGRGDLGLSINTIQKGMSFTGCHDYVQVPNCTCPTVNVNQTCTFYTGQKVFIPSDVEVFYGVRAVLSLH